MTTDMNDPDAIKREFIWANRERVLDERAYEAACQGTNEEVRRVAEQRWKNSAERSAKAHRALLNSMSDDEVRQFSDALWKAAQVLRPMDAAALADPKGEGA